MKFTNINKTLPKQNEHASEAMGALHSSTSTPRKKSNVEENPIHFIYHQLQIAITSSKLYIPRGPKLYITTIPKSKITNEGLNF